VSEILIELARAAAAASDDRATQVGCAIVTTSGELIQAANGFPAGIDRTIEARHARPEKYLWIEHAERNAIYRAARIQMVSDLT
jgi:dCMP deaminase